MNKIGFILLRLFLLCLAGALGVVLLAIIALHFDTTRMQLLTTLSSSIEKHTGWTVALANAEEISLYHWRFNGITLQKPHQSPIRIQSLECVLRPQQLLLGRVAIDQVIAQGVEVEGLPPVDVTGSVSVALARHGLRLVPTIQGRLNTQVHKLPTPLQPWLGNQAAATASFQWQSGELTLERVEVNTPQLALQGRLALNSDLNQIDSRFSATLTSLSPASAEIPITGRLAAKGQIKGSLQDPEFFLALSSDEIGVAEHVLHQVAIQLDGQWRAKALECVTSLQCQIGDIAASSEFQVRWEENSPIVLQDIHVFLPRATLQGHLTMAPNKIRGRLAGTVDDLSVWSRYWGEPLAGTAQVIALFTEEVSLDAKLQDLRLGDGLQANQLSLQLVLDDFAQPRVKQVTVTGHGVDSGELSLRDFSLEGQRAEATPGSEWAFTLAANGNWIEPLTLAASGNVQLDSKQQQGRLSIKRLTGTVRGEAIALESPLGLASHFDGIHLSPFRLKVGRGYVEGHGNVDANHFFSVTLQLKDLPLSLLSPSTMNAPLHGTVSGNAVLSGIGDNPELHMQLTGDNVSVANSSFKLIPPLKTSLIIDIKNQQLSLNGSLSGLGKRPLEVMAQLPIQVKASDIRGAGLQRHLPIRAEIRGGGEISPILEALFPGVTHFTGNTDLALAVSGTLEHPLMGGTAKLQNGTFESLDTGCVFKNIQATCAIHEDHVTIQEFQASDGEEGSVTGAGVLRFDATLGVVYEVTFDLKHVVILRRDFIKGTGTGRIQFKGQGDHSVLSGEITTTGVNGVIPQDSPSTNVTPLDVTFVNTPPAMKSQFAMHSTKAPDNPVQFDVIIHVANNTTVRGNDLQSHWKGELKLRGNAEAPELHGELKLTSGDFRVNGKPFVLKGQILFAGDIEKNTTVNVSATQEIAAGNIEAILRGPVRSPTLSLRANPPMAQREILSWILFGRGLAEASPFETSQLNQLALDVTSAGKKTNKPTMLSRLQRFGIDSIKVDSSAEDGQNNVSVNIGKYLTRGLYVSVNKGLNTEGGKVSIEADVIRNVKLKAEVDDAAASKMLLMWRHDY